VWKFPIFNGVLIFPNGEKKTEMIYYLSVILLYLALDLIEITLLMLLRRDAAKAGPERSSPFTATMLPSHFEEARCLKSLEMGCEAIWRIMRIWGDETPCRVMFYLGCLVEKGGGEAISMDMGRQKRSIVPCITGWCFGTMEFYDCPFSWE